MKVNIQRGFVLAYVALAVVVLGTAALLSTQINADVATTDANSGSNKCGNGTIKYEEIALTDEMREFYPVGVSRAYKITRPDGAVLQAVFNAKNTYNPSSLDFVPGAKIVITGDLVFTTAPTGAKSDTVVKSGVFRNKLVNASSNQSIREMIWDDIPNLAVGKHWTESKNYTIPSKVPKNKMAMLMKYLMNYQGTCTITANRLMEFSPNSGNVTPTPTATATKTKTATATATATAGDSTTPTDDQVSKYKILNGWNLIVVAQGTEEIAAKSFTGQGLTIFAYNLVGRQKWHLWTPNGTTYPNLHRKIGYYVYNPGPDKTVSVEKVAKTDNFIAVIHRGWNLLANSKSSEQGLKDISYRAVLSGFGGKCSDPDSDQCKLYTQCSKDYDTCSKFANLKTLLSGESSTKRAYGKIYLIIDGHTGDANKAFKEIEVTSENIDTVTIPERTAFWLYLFK